MVSSWELYSFFFFHKKADEGSALGNVWCWVCGVDREAQAKKFGSFCQHEVSYLKHIAGGWFLGYPMILFSFRWTSQG